jgi:hypothetical protein
MGSTAFPEHTRVSCGAGAVQLEAVIEGLAGIRLDAAVVRGKPGQMPCADLSTFPWCA